MTWPGSRRSTTTTAWRSWPWSGGAIVGVVRYDRLGVGAHEAEVAFVVRDDFQGYGLGSVLLEHLTGVARERGVRRFVAEVLPANHRMLGVFRDAGYASVTAVEDGVVRLDLEIEPTATSRAVTESREHRAESRSIERLLAPTSVAVIGASRDADSVGSTLLRNLVDSGFTGRTYAINPHASAAVQGVATYASVTDVPGAVDLAVVASPGGHPARRGRGLRDEGGARPRRRVGRLRRDRRRRGASVSDCSSRLRTPQGCGSSGRTASASSTPTPHSCSTPPCPR